MPHTALAASHSSGDALSFALTLGVVGLALVVVELVATWRVFTRAGQPRWAAVVPLYNVWIWLRIAAKPRWWLVLFFVPVANIVVGALVFREVARGFGRGRWFTAGLVLLPWAFLPLLAFGNADWSPPDQPAPPRVRPEVDRGSWVASLVATALLAALVVAWIFVPSRGDHAVAGGLTATEQSAVVAAGTIASDVASYSRAHFDQDFARALDVTTGGLRSDLVSRKATTLKALTTNKIDVYAKVQHSALVGPIEPGAGKKQAQGYVVLVALYTYTTKSPQTPNAQNLKVTVEKIKGKWLGSDVTSVGVQ